MLTHIYVPEIRDMKMNQQNIRMIWASLAFGILFTTIFYFTVGHQSVHLGKNFVILR